MIPTGSCPQCGTPFAPGAGVCTGCGAALLAPPAPPPPAPAPPPGPPMAAPAVARNSGTMFAGALLAVVALIGIGVVLTGGKDDGGATSGPATTVDGGLLPDPTGLAVGEVLLEPVNSKTPLPFTDDVRLGAELGPTISLPDIGLPVTTDTGTTDSVATGQSPPQVSGSVPGLYGGTRNEKVCDKEQMITYLETHADKGAAWAGVQGIAVADLRAYISGLTPVILTHDTLVMNHGFKNGAAFAHPSVLQAGSAVMVDEYGVPRAKCSCGNPLTPPEPLTQPPTYVGPQWPDFRPTKVIVVVPTVIIVEGITIVDLGTGELIVRPIGAGEDTPDLATGDVRITLSWADSADLDLAVRDPNGDIIDFDTRTSPSGGLLDVDANSNCEVAISEPAENVVWADAGPPGQYTVQVSLYSDCAAPGEHPFLLQALIDGLPVQVQLLGANNSLSPSDGTGSLSATSPTLYFVITRG